MTPHVSVVIPTRDRPDALGECLDAIAALADDGVEVVVVDDASRDTAAVERAARRHPGTRIVAGEGRGPAAARNRGADAARGTHVVFLDDDCRPRPGWLAAIVARLEGGEAVVAGRTEAGPPSDAFAAATQLVTNHLMLATLDDGHVTFAPTCNVGCRAAIRAGAPFDESFPLAAGEDREWCARLGERGVSIAYEPAAVVEHRPGLTARRFWRQHERYGRGAHRLHRRRGARVRAQSPRFYAGLLVGALRAGWRVGALVLVAQLATGVGVAREAVAARRRRPDGVGPAGAAGSPSVR